ncbi:hypothetical protein L2E82_32320 [Cichorium intybus]|uniref:Uncharacterized protein n=1 Tax=Cichorium intybus TaxID=13427 RepID=A0ACB9BGG6_CICIN|nr:hypothetical protein L2E82_32320 [Cichorium intybus]
MDWNPQTLQSLSQSFLDTLSPQPELRRGAEKNLSYAANSPNYGLSVLPRWPPSSSPRIPDDEKEQIKTLIVPLMLSATPKIQAQISKVLAVIGNDYWSKLWPVLLPDLRSSLETAINTNDFASANGILSTINSFLKKFRYQFKSDPILLDLNYCVDNFGAPSLTIFDSISRKINAAAAGSDSVATLRQVLEAQRLCCRIFYSLSILEKFEDNADEWMNNFNNHLTVRYPAIEDGGDADCLTLVDDLRAAVCENISLYMEKKEEVLQKHISDFVTAVCNLLVVASASKRLTMSGIKFLSMVSKSVHHELLSGDEIMQYIVIPNVMLRDEDEDLFEMNYVEFIRRDMEGDTRRRNAGELLIKVHTLVDLINSVEPDLFHVILGEFWIPNLKTITGYTEIKLSAVASTKLLCESAVLLDPAAEELWGKLLDAVVTLLSLPEEERVVDDEFDFDFDFDFGGYEEATFVGLHNVGKKAEDPLKEIEDPRRFFVGFPANISSQFHGRFPLVIMRCLSVANQAALVKLCNSYNIAIV